MSEEPRRSWRFGVADLLAAVTAVGLWLGLFPMIRRIQPVIDPVFLTVVLTGMLGLLLAAFVTRKRSKSLAVGCFLLATIYAFMLFRICVTNYG